MIDVYTANAICILTGISFLVAGYYSAFVACLVCFVVVTFFGS